MRVGRSEKQGLRLKIRMTLLSEPGSTLGALPTPDGPYALLRLSGVHDQRLHGGRLEDERDAHPGRDGEWGRGRGGAGLRARADRQRGRARLLGDGYCFGGRFNQCTVVCSVVADSIGRNGMSVVSASDPAVTRSGFANTRGTAPQAGLDIEPDDGGAAERIPVRDSVLRFSRADGLMVVGCKTCAANRDNVIEGNVIADNLGDGLVLRHENHRVRRNRIERSGGHGVRLWNSHRITVEDHIVTESGCAGRQLEGARAGVLRGNVLRGIQGAWRLRWSSVDNVFEDNRCNDNAAATSPDPPSSGNRFARNDGRPGGP